MSLNLEVYFPPPQPPVLLLGAADLHLRCHPLSRCVNPDAEPAAGVSEHGARSQGKRSCKSPNIVSRLLSNGEQVLSGSHLI